MVKNLSSLFILLSTLHAFADVPEPISKQGSTKPMVSVAPGASEDDDHSGDNTLDEEPQATRGSRITHTDMTTESGTEKPSATPGEKIFDWSKYKGATEVPHPFAEKGLIRITKDRTYLYKVPETEEDRAISFQVGPFDPTNLRNPDATDGRGASFAENYDQSTAPAVLFTKEWQLIRSAIGKLGLRAGSGIFVAQGHGHFVSNTNASKTPKEQFTLLTFPTSIGGVYRMQFVHRQLFIPFAEGGLTAFPFTEIRDDGKAPKFAGSAAAYAAGGLAINMTYFDYLTRIQLNREYGISAIYLTLEFRRLFALSPHYDFSSNYINGGFLFEY